MKTTRWLNNAVLAIILSAFCLQAFLALPKLSATTDEVAHIVAGYSYWHTRDFRLNPEHPPLAKLLAAFPLLFIHPKFDPTQEDWKRAAEYPLGYDFLYQNNADQILFWSRVPMVLMAAIGLLATFLWARDMFGVPAGFFAAGLYAFSPNLLAHGMLVTTDVPLAAFTVLTLYMFWKRRDLYAGLALGIAMASKFSGVFLPMLIAILCVARDGRGALKRLVIMGATSLLVIEASYFFSASPLLYFTNGRTVNTQVVPNYPFYLFGQLKPGGWWYYFLIAFAVKATIPTLLLLAVTTIEARNGFIDRWGEITLMTTIALFFVITTIGANQIGFRYLLPVFPLIFIWAGRVVSQLAASRGGIVAITVLLVWQTWAAVHTFPNYIPYFNELAGGPAGGPAILDDSNVDWGQGLKQAAEYVRSHRLENVHMYSFSPLDNPPYYGLPPNIPRSEVFEKLVSNRPAKGVYIISAHYAVRMRTANPVWNIYKPIDRIGESLWVYAF